MVELTRRRLLEFGVGAAGLSLAGCLGEPRSDPNTEWFPADATPFLMAYLDLTVTSQNTGVDPVIPLFLPSDGGSDSTEYVPDLPGAEELDDPLVRTPLAVGGQVIAGGALAIAASGLGRLVDPDRPTQGVTELYVTNDTTIGVGDIDVEAADESLRAGTDGILGEIKFTPTDDIGGYTLYEAGTEDGEILGLSSDAVVIADTESTVRTAIETRRGDHDRLAETDETAGWLFDTAGTGNLSVGWVDSVDLAEQFWGDQSMSESTELLAEHDHVLSTLSFAPEDGELTATLALEDSSLDDDHTDRIENRFGSAAGDTSLSIEENRLSLEGTYTDDVLDIGFAEPGAPEGTPVPSGEDVPEKVTEAVEDVTFAFEPRLDEGHVRVEFHGTVAADSVTIRARPSGGEISTSTPENMNFVNVQVASDDEEVVVIATVDDASGIVARTEL